MPPAALPALFAAAAAAGAGAGDLFSPPIVDAPATRGVPTLWLPLGDSITWGCGTDARPGGSAACAADAGGYRVPLAWALTQAGRDVTTMGTLTTGPAGVPPAWLRHEGHPGWRWDQIDGLLDQSLATSPQPPDLITIHLGTNDCGQGAPAATVQARMESLLSHIHLKAPKAAVYLASVIGAGGTVIEPCVAAFNALIPAAVAEWAAKGMDITYVPMFEWSGVCVADAPLSGLCCSGQVHPTAAGYLRMASAFALAIAEPKQPPPAPPPAPGQCTFARTPGKYQEPVPSTSLLCDANGTAASLEAACCARADCASFSLGAGGVGGCLKPCAQQTRTTTGADGYAKVGGC